MTMIITDIKQIDHVAEEAFVTAKGIISVDMKDYASIKERSGSMKAISIEVAALSEEALRSLDGLIAEVGKENLSNILLYIRYNGSDAGIPVIAVEQLNMLVEMFSRQNEAANIIWGIGEGSESPGNVSILIVLGYGD